MESKAEQPAVKEPLTERGKKTKQKILSAAEKLIGENGYYNTSIVDITREAGVAHGSFYTYFATKYDVYKELIEQLNREFRYQIKEAVKDSESFEEVQRTGLKTFLQWVSRHRNLYSIVQQAVVIDESLYQWYYRKIAEGHMKAIKNAALRKEITDLDYETIAYSLMGLTQFIGMRWVYWEKSESKVPEQIIEDAVNIMMNGLRNR